jgi:hypothetical protein
MHAFNIATDHTPKKSSNLTPFMCAAREREAEGTKRCRRSSTAQQRSGQGSNDLATGKKI